MIDCFAAADWRMAMFKNVKSIWNTYDLNFYIIGFIFSAISIFLFPIWIWMVLMNIKVWFSNHAANQERKDKDWRELINLRKMVGQREELQSPFIDKYIDDVVQIDDETFSILYKINENVLIKRVCTINELFEDYSKGSVLRILQKYNINIPGVNRPM
jgi:hypothetical protein